MAMKLLLRARINEKWYVWTFFGSNETEIMVLKKVTYWFILSLETFNLLLNRLGFLFGIVSFSSILH